MKTLPVWHLQRLNLWKSLSQSGVQKFTASAMLKPKLKPLWYADDRVMMNSPGFWICLFSPLDDLDVRTHRLEHVRVDHRRLVPQQLGALDELLRHAHPHEGLEFLVVGARYAVPELRRPVVVEVDAGHVQVLHVPREGRSEAAYVQVRRVDARQRAFAQRVAD